MKGGSPGKQGKGGFVSQQFPATAMKLEFKELIIRQFVRIIKILAHSAAGYSCETPSICVICFKNKPF